MAFIPMESGAGDVIDMSVFEDYANFTQPTLGASVSSASGGYKRVGNLVYVYMAFYLDKNAFDTSTSISYLNLATGLPEPLTWTPFAVGRWGISTVVGGTLGKYGAGQTGWLTAGVIPNEVKNSSSPRIIVKFVYNAV